MVRANASRRKAMSYARMSEKQKILAAEVSELLAEAEKVDTDSAGPVRPTLLGDSSWLSGGDLAEGRPVATPGPRPRVLSVRRWSDQRRRHGTPTGDVDGLRPVACEAEPQYTLL